MPQPRVAAARRSRVPQPGAAAAKEDGSLTLIVAEDGSPSTIAFASGDQIPVSVRHDNMAFVRQQAHPRIAKARAACVAGLLRSWPTARQPPG